MRFLPLLLVALLSPRVARADADTDAVMAAGRAYWLRLVCETHLVVKMDDAVKRRSEILSQGAAGQLSPERYLAEKRALGSEMNAIWRAESLPSKDYVKVKLMALVLLNAGRPTELRFAEDVHVQSARSCPKKAADRRAVVSAAMGMIPTIANDPGAQPPHTDEKRGPPR